ncbi:DUF1559 domain-containing protein [Singulisphaera sp. PoT]|uniref:DUF1559 family PulG-like putative transporter n=1 Tax=Singulisphaera sp. PoT TaxID=3411797 RepID=UPI003BF4E9E3
MNNNSRGSLKFLDMVAAVGICMCLALIVISSSKNNRPYTRRFTCQNNLLQIGRGLLAFSNARNTFPNAGTFLDDPKVHRGDPRKSSILPAIHDPRADGGNSKALLRSWVVDILPYIDAQELYDGWNFQRDYLDTTTSPTTASNFQLASTMFGILRCPEDATAATGQGNLSYAVNGGFMRWPAVPISWNGSPQDGASNSGPPLQWAPAGADWRETQAIGKKLGVMFLGTHTGDQPWDIRTTPKDISDGASHTILAGENALVGYSPKGSPFSGKRETNWACPLPNFVMFIGSDDICRSENSAIGCLAGQLATTPRGIDGRGWRKSNLVGTHQNINFGRKMTVEGSFPFANSHHPDGSRFVFCDGSVRFLSDPIDGTVYSKLLTPAGESLPEAIRQLKLGGKLP